MGSKLSKSEVECFNEIRFILTAFKNKYEEYPDFEKLPRYGLDIMISSLDSPQKINWKRLEDFVRMLSSWMIDTSFILSVENSFRSNNYNTDILSSYYSDVYKLQEKINEIIDKHNCSNYKISKKLNII